MSDYKKSNRFNKPSSRPFSREGSPREMHNAQCNGCKEPCQVPFRPNGKKPVYCANCFTKNDSQGSSSYAPKRDFAPRYPSAAPVSQMPDRQIQELTKQIEVMNGTLQKLVSTFETFNRAADLASEIRKHVPMEDTPPAKEAVKKVAKTTKTKKA